MTDTDVSVRERLQALFFSVLMITSMSAGVVVLGGSSAVAQDGSSGDVITVDAGADVANGNESLFASLTYAIDNASSGDRIEVRDNGTYRVHEFIDSDLPDAQNGNIQIRTKNLTIVGVDGTPTILYNSSKSGDNGGQPALKILADNTTIENLEVVRAGDPEGDNAGQSVKIGQNAAEGDFDDFVGVLISDVTASTKNRTADASPGTLGGIAVDDSNVTISGSEVVNSGAGIYTYNNANVTLDDNSVDLGDASSVFSDVDIGVVGAVGTVNGESNEDSVFSTIYENNNVVNSSVGGVARTDQSGSPGIESVEINDTDTDGDIENVTITATENLSDADLSPSDFEIGGENPDRVSTGASAYDEVVVLVFNESDLDGTGAAVITEADTASADLTDLAGNTNSDIQLAAQSIIDSAEPVVESISPTPAKVNAGNAPSTVDVSVTFSEDVTIDSGQLDIFPAEVRQETEGRVTVTIDSVNNETVTGTTDSQLGDETANQDYFAGFDIPRGAVTDTAGNPNVELNTSEVDGFDRLLDVDEIPPQLSDSTITTLDTNDDGQVDQLEVEFNDDVNDSTVDPEDFTISEPAATVESVDTGATENDNIVLLNVSGLPEANTSVTPVVTVEANSIEDTAGNTGPAVSGGETQEAVDGADPVVVELTVDDTGDSQGAASTVLINEADTPAPIQIQVDFSENLSSAPTATVLNSSGSLRTSTSVVDGSFNSDQVTYETDNNITDINEETSLFVEVSGSTDNSSNSNPLVTFNESRITVDTLAPETTVDDSLADGLQDGTIDISDNVSVSGDDIAEIQVKLTDESGSTLETFDSKSALNDFLSSFDTTQFEDGTVTVAVNATDTASNLGNTDSGSLDVDNTAPDVTINEPAETTAAPSNGTLTVNVTVDEPNIAGDATVVLEGENNTIVYDVSVTEGDNTFTLKLNTSENATADGAILPNQSATNGSFETKVVYDLSVTVDDATGQSTTATQADALFLDNTPPENFSLLAPDEPAEYGENGRNSLVIAYGYTEDNTDSVTVELTNETGDVVRTVQVDESQYTDDGVIKSFELEEEIDFKTLADGRYNVSVTVTDLAGNELTESTTNAPIYVNNDEGSDGTISISDSSASADLNTTTEQVTVNVTYNVSVENLNDTGDLPEDQVEAQLENVTITAADDVVTATVTYYDESAGEYNTIDSQNVPLSEFEGIEVVDNETITAAATASVNISDVFGDVLAEDDRVLDYTVNVNSGADITVEATGNVGSDTATETVSDDSATLVSQDPVEPQIESVEVVGNVGDDTPAETLRITFTRPVEVTDGSLTPSDFGYQDINGDGSNFIDDVEPVDGPTETITVVLGNGSVTPGDVGSDIVSLQDESVLENARSGDLVSADSGTIQEVTPPALDDVEVGENATQVTVTFDQPVQAGDGGDLTAANFTYVDANGAGASGIESVEQVNDTTVVLTLNASATTDDLSSDSIEVPTGEVFDQFGNSNDASLEAGLNEEIKPSGVEIVAPTDQLIKQSDGTLQISYEYVENIPDGTDEVVVYLENQQTGDFVRYEIEDDQYVGDGSTKTIAVDLDNPDLNDGALNNGQLDDGTYKLRLVAVDQKDNFRTDTVSDVLVINDEAPEVTNVGVDPDDDVAPDETINVSYDYDNPGVNATSVTVHIVDSDDVDNFTSGDFANATFAQVTEQIDDGSSTQTVEVDLSGLDAIQDNDDYRVFVTAVDESGLTNLNVSADPIIQPADSQSGGDVGRPGAKLDVNAAQPTLESVETDAGSRTVTVTFSEEIVAADGEISLDDFAYQDVSGDGASSIESVQQVGPQTVELTLDSEVTASDLGADLVNVRQGALEDTDGDNARQVPLDATALADTTSPAVEISAATDSAINADNQGAFTFDVSTDEPATVTVTVTGSEGTTRTQTVDVSSQTEVTFDLSGLADGPVSVSAEATDAGDNTGTDSFEISKDTVAPSIESATTNAGTNTVTVTFDETVTGFGQSDFSITSPDHSVESVTDLGPETVRLTLNATVPPEAINTSDVVITSTATDAAGNPATGESVLTDNDEPTIDSISAERNTTTITVTFSEIINGGEDELSASDFVYTDNDGAGASEIVSVEQVDHQTVEITVDAPLTPSDLADDTIAAAENSVFDAAGNAAPSEARSPGFEAELTATADGDAVTIRLVTASDISDAIDTLELSEDNRELAELEGFVLDERFTETLNASDFHEVEHGVYETTVTVPEDDTYTVSGELDNAFRADQTTVDTSAPEPVDAAIIDVTSEAQLDDTRDTTLIRVLFDEPVDASEISPSDVTVEGLEGEIVEIRDAGAFGAVQVVVEGDLQTGDSPDVTIAGDSYADLAGTHGVERGATTIHTDVLQLEEGVNFVSVPAAAGSLSVSELPLDHVESISRYDAESGEFETFVPGAPDNPFTELDGGEGYIVRMEGGATVPINVPNEPTGESAPNAVELSEGYNLIGHFQEAPQDVETALSSVTAGEGSEFEDVVFVVLRQDEEAGGFTYESYTADEFEQLEDGEAYWVFVTDDQTYTEASFERAR